MLPSRPNAVTARGQDAIRVDGVFEPRVKPGERVGGEFLFKQRWVIGTGRGNRISSGSCPSE
jgi:hypothetical protein